MEHNYERVFGKLEKIVDIVYYNGLVSSTRFEMQMFDETNNRWTGQRREFYFLGCIPAEYIGHEAMYFSATPQDNNSDAISSTYIEIGKITPRGTGTYDIIEDKQRDPRIPKRITGREMKEYNLQSEKKCQV